MNSEPKILFVTNGNIGDAVMTTGVLSALADRYQGAAFTIAGGPAVASLFESFPRLERFIVLQKQKWHRHWVSLWQLVREEKWDVVVDLRGSLLSVFLRTKARHIFWNPDKSKTKAEQLAALLKLDTVPPMHLWPDNAARQRAAALLPADKEAVCFAPVSNSPKKDWPIEHFIELAKRLYRGNRVFVVLATGRQRDAIAPLVASLPEDSVCDLSGRTDLMTAYAVIERSTLFVGNDSGLLHMAATSGVRCVGIYGPTDGKMYAPRGRHVTVVGTSGVTMRMIPVDQVEAACMAAGSAGALAR